MCDPFPYGGCVYCDECPNCQHAPCACVDSSDPDMWHDRQIEDDIEWKARR